MSEPTRSPLECDHGRLARTCPLCDYEEQIARLRALVRRLEWTPGQIRWDGQSVCPVCGWVRCDGHAAGCEIAEVLR